MNTRYLWLLFLASCARTAAPRTPVDVAPIQEGAPPTVVVRGDLTAALLGLSVAQSSKPSSDPAAAPESVAGTFITEGTSIWVEVRPKAGRVLRSVPEESTILAMSDDRGTSLLESRSRIAPGVVVDDGKALVVLLQTPGMPCRLARRVLARARLTIETAGAEKVARTTLPPGETRRLETPVGIVSLQRSDAVEDGADFGAGGSRGAITRITIDNWDAVGSYLSEPRFLGDGLLAGATSQLTQITNGKVHESKSFSFRHTDQPIEIELPVRVPVRHQLELEVSAGLGIGPR